MRPLVYLSAVTLAAGLLTGQSAVALAAVAPQDRGTVTLITGDQVVMPAGAPQSPEVR